MIDVFQKIAFCVGTGMLIFVSAFLLFLLWEFLLSVWCTRGIRKYNAEDAFYRKHAFWLMAKDWSDDWDHKPFPNDTTVNDLVETYMEKSRDQEGGI